jgi:E3 ubiquitin-protein ligase listerin
MCIQLYELISVHSEPIQDVAFQILHRYVPSIQEDLSIELALTASQEEPLKIEFEPALIALLKDVPLDSHWENVSVEKGQYISLKTYLLSWLLVFDHFENSVCIPYLIEKNDAYQNFRLSSSKVNTLIF